MKKTVFRVIGLTLLFTAGFNNLIFAQSKYQDYEPGSPLISGLYKDGTAIFFNPETNKVCNIDEFSLNVNTYKTQTGIKTGCMKWYIFNDTELNDTVSVILDHNTTPSVTWNSNLNNTDMLEIKQALENDISTWDEEIKSTARLIKAEEVAKITNNKNFDILTTPYSGYFYFDTNTSNNDPTINAAGLSKYAWLFDNLYGCTSYGCNVEDNNSYNLYNSNSLDTVRGYWTSSPVAFLTYSSWFVFTQGSLNNGPTDIYGGVRPVIEIKKNPIINDTEEDLEQLPNEEEKEPDDKINNEKDFETEKDEIKETDKKEETVISEVIDAPDTHLSTPIKLIIGIGSLLILIAVIIIVYTRSLKKQKEEK